MLVKATFILSCLLLSGIACKDTVVVYVPTENKTTIFGSWRWIRSTTLFDPSVLLTPESEGHNRVYVFDADSVARRNTYYFSGDTLIEMRKYHFEKYPNQDSLGTLEIIIEESDTHTWFLLTFMCMDSLKWESIGPESVTLVWKREN